jgi:hypothetical protein
MPKAGAVISHRIHSARDIVVEGDVAMEALMESLETEKVGRRAGGGGRAFTLPEDSCCVIMTIV